MTKDLAALTEEDVDEIISFYRNTLRLNPRDFGMDDGSVVAWTIVSLVEQDKIKDSGRRRNGRIVWVAADQETLQ